MIALVAVLVLLANLASLHSFTLSHGWIARKISRTNAVPKYDFLKKDEVYMGDLPPSFSLSDLKTLLRQKDITNYVNVSVLSYGTSDREMYGCITFSSFEETINARYALRGVEVDGRPVDVAPMPKAFKIRVLFVDKSDVYRNRNDLLTLRMNENVAAVSFGYKNQELSGGVLRCWGPPQAARLLHHLSVRAWKDRAVQLSLFVDPQQDRYCVELKNLYPTITEASLTSVLNELLGPGQFDSVSLKESTTGIYF